MKSTLINNRVSKPANMTGPQQPTVPGSSKAQGSGGKKLKPGTGRGSCL